MDEETSGRGNDEPDQTRYSGAGRRDGVQPNEDFGLRKRKVASKEHLAVAGPSGGGGIRTGLTSMGILEERDRGQPRKMKRSWKKRFMAKFAKRTIEKPPELEKEIEEELKALEQQGFQTADIHKGYDAAYIVFAMRDFFLYLIYLTCLLLIAVGSQYSAHNYYSDLIHDILTDTKFTTEIMPGYNVTDTFHSIKSPKQIWRFVEDVLLDVLFDSKDPNGLVLLESILVGAPAIRQIRVLNNTCETAPLFKDLYKTCYDYYSYEFKDRNNMNPTDSNQTMSYPWEYFSEFTLRGTTAPYVGILGSYGGGGFKLNLTSDRAFNRKWLAELEEGNWIRIGARYVTIDFVLYTPNTNLFCVAKLNFELIPAGGVINHDYFYTLKLFRYSTPYDTFILACEMIFICFTCYFTFEEAQQMYVLKEDYLANWWNILDITIILTSIATIALGIYRFTVVTISLREQLLFIRTSINSNFDQIVYAQDIFNLSMAWLVFFAWVKLLKFSSLNRSILALLNMFQYVGEELATVFAMGIIIGIGYGLCGHVLFGHAVFEYFNVRRSCFAMLSVIIGRFKFYEECHRIYPIIAPLFFTSYIILIVTIYCNMFVALLVHGFSKVIVFMNEEPDRLYLDDWVYAIVLHIMTVCRQYTTVQNIMAKNALGRMNRDYNELIQILKRHGYQGTELQLLLDTYDIRQGVELNVDDMLELYNDVCVRNQLFIEVEDHNDIQKVMDKIENMIEHCDQAILDVTSKAEILTDKIAKTEGLPVRPSPGPKQTKR